MPQEPPRQNPDQVFVFQQTPGGTERYLVPSGNIPTGMGNARLKTLKLTDLMNLVGLREPGGDVSPRVKSLTLDDIHILGRIMANHWNKDYPDKIFSCCCCG